MDEKLENILKYIALAMCIILFTLICVLYINAKRVTEDLSKPPIKPPLRDEMPELEVPTTKPETVQPAEEPKSIIQQEIEKEVQPLMRDENNMPKSDVNVPEIG